MIELPRPLAVQHHIECRPILDRPPGVEILRLGKDLDPRELPGNLLQAQQRRIADGRKQRFGFGTDEVDR
jgi:hypothetical protein